MNSFVNIALLLLTTLTLSNANIIAFTQSTCETVPARCWCWAPGVLNNQGFCLDTQELCRSATLGVKNVHCGSQVLNSQETRDLIIPVTFDISTREGCESSNMCFCWSPTTLSSRGFCVFNDLACTNSAKGVLDLHCSDRLLSTSSSSSSSSSTSRDLVLTPTVKPATGPLLTRSQCESNGLCFCSQKNSPLSYCMASLEVCQSTVASGVEVSCNAVRLECPKSSSCCCTFRQWWSRKTSTTKCYHNNYCRLLGGRCGECPLV
jgi:hypothetical protein